MISKPNLMFIGLAASLLLAGCNGGSSNADSVAVAPVTDVPVADPDPVPTVQLTGQVVDGPIANAKVTIDVDGKSYTTITDASGNYTITVPSANADAFMTATATADGGVELVSLLGTFATLQAQGVDPGSINITNVTTAKAVLIKAANDGNVPANQAQLEELDKNVDTTRLLDLAVAIKLVIDNPEFALPTDSATTLDLVSDPDAVNQFLADVDAVDPTARTTAAQAILDDPALVSGYTDSTVPSVYRIVYANVFDAGVRYAFKADHTGAVSADGYNQSYTWATDDSGRLVVTYGGGGLVQQGFCDSDAGSQIRCDSATTKSIFKLVTAGAQADTLLEEDVGTIAYPDNDQSATDPTTYDDTSNGVGVKPAGVIAFDPAAIPGTWAVPGIGLDPLFASGESLLNVEPGLITFNADNTGNVNATNRTFTWKLDTDNSLLLSFADGTTIRLLRLRKDGIAMETLAEVTDATGKLFAGGAEMLKVDPDFVFTTANVPGRYNLLPGDDRYDTFNMRFDAAGLGAEEYLNTDGTLADEYDVEWAVTDAGALQTKAVYNVTTGTYVAPCDDPANCQIYKTRDWTPIAADGNRVYVLEFQQSYDWDDTADFHQGAMYFSQRTIRFWDKSAVDAATQSIDTSSRRTESFGAHAYHPVYKPLFPAPVMRLIKN